MKIRQTIKRVLNEGIKDKLIKLIDETGIVSAARYVGGYDELKRLLGDYEIPYDMKIDVIQELVSQDEYEGINLFDFGGPISYKEDSEGIHQIEYLGRSKAIINIWGGYEFSMDKGEYGVYYENLPEKALNDIFEIALEDLI